MPLSGPSSYPTTLDAFLAHWALVNTDLGAAGPMTLQVGTPSAPESVTVAVLAALRTSLSSAQDQVQSALNGVELKRGLLTVDKRVVLDQAQAFGRSVRASFPPGTPWPAMLPEMPSMSAAPETFLRPMRDVRDVWAKLESEVDELVLPDGTTQAAFAAAVTALDTTMQEMAAAEIALRYEREKRNALQDRAVLILNRYRPTVESLVPPDSPLVTTIPRMRPAPGHTPEPVALTATWDEAEAQARLEWEASDDADLASYQVRMSPAEEYDADAESIVATLLPAAARELLTTAGLPLPGATASYKVYVILATDNESGSNAVPVTRP